MLLSGLGRAELDAVLSKGALPGMTPESITDPDCLRAHLEHVRAEGVAVDIGESDSAMRCVAAAVRDHSGAIIAAMSLSAPIIRWTAQAQVEWTELIREGAATLSARMGYLAPPR
jgi:DNA-binding IclR family transcriptional regulator